MQAIVDVNSVEKSYGLTQVINRCSFIWKRHRESHFL